MNTQIDEYDEYVETHFDELQKKQMQEISNLPDNGKTITRDLIISLSHTLITLYQIKMSGVWSDDDLGEIDLSIDVISKRIHDLEKTL